MRLTKMKVIKRADRPFLLMVWTDPKTGRTRQETTKRTTKKAARHDAGQRAIEIAQGTHRDRVEWDTFCSLYESKGLVKHSKKSKGQWRTARNALVAFHRPRFLDQVTTELIAEWQVSLFQRVDDEGNPNPARESTVSAYSAKLKAALNWAVKKAGLLAEAPRIEVGEYDVRGRPLSKAELAAYLAAIKEERPNDHREIRRFVEGLVLSGLRISELMKLSWSPSSTVWLDAGREYPAVTFTKSGQKGRRKSDRPIAPAFWDLCQETPPAARTGLVFDLPNGMGGRMANRTMLGILSAIGRATGIVTDPETSKMITAHDLRRTFARNMHGKLPLADVRDMLGHRHTKTTDRYLQGTRTDEIAEKLWGKPPRVIDERDTG